MRNARYEDEDDLPRRRGRVAEERQSRYEDEDDVVDNGRKPWWRRNTGDTIAVGIVGLVALGIGVNALTRQSGPHPAPLFATAVIQPQAPAPVPPARPAEPQAAAASAAEPTLASAASAPAAAPARQRDELVAEVQRELTRRRIYDGTVDGMTGPKTEGAIRRYQEQTGLRQTGEATQQLLNHIRRQPVPQSQRAAAAPAPARPVQQAPARPVQQAAAPARPAAAPARPAQQEPPLSVVPAAPASTRSSEPQSIAQILERDGRPQAPTRTAAVTPTRTAAAIPAPSGPRSIGDILAQDSRAGQRSR